MGFGYVERFGNVSWAKGVLVTIMGGCSPPQVELRVWTSPDGEGTPVAYWSDGSYAALYFGAEYPGGVAHEVLTPSWVQQAFSIPGVLGELPCPSAVFLLDKKRGVVLAATDRVGIQGVYYAPLGQQGWLISTHLMWLLLELGHPGDVDRDGFVEHLAFGYSVTPGMTPYRDVRRLPPSTYVVVEGPLLESARWCADSNASNTSDVPELHILVEALKCPLQRTSYLKGWTIGVTAGKDSLCLAASIGQMPGLSSASFGAKQCPDRLQGMLIAQTLGLSHSETGVCPDRLFLKWADHVAFHSAGLATASYVDMTRFVSLCIPPYNAFVMGEGGNASAISSTGQMPAHCKH